MYKLLQSCIRARPGRGIEAAIEVPGRGSLEPAQEPCLPKAGLGYGDSQYRVGWGPPQSALNTFITGLVMPAPTLHLNRVRMYVSMASEHFFLFFRALLDLAAVVSHALCRTGSHRRVVFLLLQFRGPPS